VSRHDPKLLGLDEMEDAVTISREAEESVFFFDDFKRDTVLRASASQGVVFPIASNRTVRVPRLGTEYCK